MHAIICSREFEPSFATRPFFSVDAGEAGELRRAKFHCLLALSAASRTCKKSVGY